MNLKMSIRSSIIVVKTARIATNHNVPYYLYTLFCHSIFLFDGVKGPMYLQLQEEHTPLGPEGLPVQLLCLCMISSFESLAWCWVSVDVRGMITGGLVRYSDAQYASFRMPVLSVS